MSGSEKWRIDREYRSAETSPTLQMFFLPCFCSFLVYQSDLGYLWQHQISPFLKNRKNKTLRFNEFFASQSKSASLLTPCSTLDTLPRKALFSYWFSPWNTPTVSPLHGSLSLIQLSKWRGKLSKNRVIMNSYIAGSIPKKRQKIFALDLKQTYNKKLLRHVISL